MKRLTHQQYTRIGMIEDVLADLDLTGRFSLFVDTWRSTPETYTRLVVSEDEALLGSIDGEWYAKEILALHLAEDGTIIDDDGGVLAVDDHHRITPDELSEYLAGYQNTED